MEIEGLEAFDKRVFAVTERWNTPAIVTVFRWITLFGNFQTLLAVIVVTTGFLLALWAAGLSPAELGRHPRVEITTWAESRP